MHILVVLDHPVEKAVHVDITHGNPCITAGNTTVQTMFIHDFIEGGKQGTIHGQWVDVVLLPHSTEHLENLHQQAFEIASSLLSTYDGEFARIVYY